MTRPPDPRRGDYILAEHIAYLYWLADRPVRVVPPLFLGPDGSIALGTTPGIWIKFTGAPGGTSGKAHPWQEVEPVAGGGWIPRVRTGSVTDDPAFDVNGSTSDLTGKYARAWRDGASYEMRFAYGAC